MRSVLLQTFTIDIGPGNVTQTLPFDLINLSWAKTVTLELRLTTIATDVGDSLDVKWQETRDNARRYYDTRGRFRAVLGNTAASAVTPYADQMTISEDVDLTAAERNPVPTGSSTGTEIPAGTVRDGPFAPPIRTNTGRVSTNQLVVAITGDGNSNSHFVGTCELWSHHWGNL